MRGSIRHRLSVAAALMLIGAVAAAWRYTTMLGYWGGSPIKWVPATAAPPPAWRGTVAVFWSGDMGFNTGMGPRIAARLAAHGIPVMGVNSLNLFRLRRTPAEVGTLVTRAAAAALRRPGATRVLLIGQSFGANTLLAGARALPPQIRRRVIGFAFVVPGETMLYRTTPGGALDVGDDGPAIGAARALDWAPVLCIHGAVEPESLCPIWQAENVTGVALPGGHFLRSDTRAVADAILAGLARMLPALALPRVHAAQSRPQPAGA